MFSRPATQEAVSLSSRASRKYLPFYLILRSIHYPVPYRSIIQSHPGSISPYSWEALSLAIEEVQVLVPFKKCEPKVLQYLWAGVIISIQQELSVYSESMILCCSGHIISYPGSIAPLFRKHYFLLFRKHYLCYSGSIIPCYSGSIMPKCGPSSQSCLT